MLVLRPSAGVASAIELEERPVLDVWAYGLYEGREVSFDVPAFPTKLPFEPEWASYVEKRRPQFKVHRNRGQAKNAVMYSLHGWPRGGVIYHNVDGKWEVFFVYEQDMTCTICGEQIEVLGQACVHEYKVPKDQTRLDHWECKYPEKFRPRHYARSGTIVPSS